MLEPKQHWIRLCRFAMAGLLTTVWTFTAERAVSQASSRQLGTVKSIAADTISLTTDAAQLVLVHVAPDAKLVKLPAGSKDMKDAQPTEMKDVAVGDRVLVRGNPGEDSSSFVASSVIVMKGEDIQQKRQGEQEDWQKHGTGGLVSSVDATANAITLSSGRAGDSRKTIVHVSSSTVVRRYAPDSVKFEDAQLSTLAQIKPGDQLRARGSRTAEGDVNAEQIVSGSFRNLAGSVIKVDPAAGVLTIKDAATQKTVEIKISADSQLRRLPEMAAQRMASRLSVRDAAAGAPPSVPTAAGAAPSGSPAPGGTGGQIPGREAPELQQILGRLPKMPVEDLHAGDAVMIVATPGLSNGEGTVITLLAGVEAILAATPKGSQVMTLSPWNINGNPGEASQ